LEKRALEKGRPISIRTCSGGEGGENVLFVNQLKIAKKFVMRKGREYLARRTAKKL